ncbi:ABC transporter permease [Desulfovibrio sp. Fe33]|uniref:ABC transporter permease n=1 Tax=Desulfovibrio sp. Fe33 TaxID=3020842 RepID=UPI00234C8DA0|nr:ABC transporter permease [Desulfovibrio sp. Fe33]
MIATIACQNLFHDKLRLVVTLTGIVFSVVLITIQVGLFLGFTITISSVIDHSGADVWVTSPGVKNFDIALPLKESKYYDTLSVPGVASASKFITQFANWKRPDGGQESIQIVGFEPAKGMGGPWGMVAGSTDLLDLRDGIIPDQLYVEKLGVPRQGEVVEINDKRARVVGFTRGIRSFTTSPFVFASLDTAWRVSNLKPGEFTYILVKADKGVSPEALRDAIRKNVQGVDAYTTPEFSWKTQQYWMFNTGAGAGILIAAFLGMVVGTVIVAQTLYATTLDHISEFATLKAMGAPNSYIYSILLAQASLSAVLGYGFGIAISIMVSRFSDFSATAIVIPPLLGGGMFFLTLFMCIGSALISIRKVMTLDPILVFKGR